MLIGKNTLNKFELYMSPKEWNDILDEFKPEEITKIPTTDEETLTLNQYLNNLWNNKYINPEYTVK